MTNILDLKDIDPETGLVRLPPGEFWRIEKRTGISPDGKYPFRIRRLSVRRGFLGIKITEEYMDDFVVFHPREGALLASQQAAGNGNRERKARADLNAESGMLGDYPPKRVGD